MVARGLRPAAVLGIVAAACLVATPAVRDPARGTFDAVPPDAAEQAIGVPRAVNRATAAGETASEASAAASPVVATTFWRDPLLGGHDR